MRSAAGLTSKKDCDRLSPYYSLFAEGIIAFDHLFSKNTLLKAKNLLQLDNCIVFIPNVYDYKGSHFNLDSNDFYPDPIELTTNYIVHKLPRFFYRISLILFHRNTYD